MRDPSTRAHSLAMCMFIRDKVKQGHYTYMQASTCTCFALYRVYHVQVHVLYIDGRSGRSAHVDDW